MAEKFLYSLPGIHPMYGSIALNPGVRELGIESASRTIADEFGNEEGLRLQNSLRHFSQDLDASMNSCIVEKNERACRSAIVFAAEIAHELQEADKIRLSRGKFPTIVFEVSEHISGAKNTPTPETTESF